MNDNDLIIPPAVATVKPEWKTWMQENGNELESLDSDVFADLEGFGTALAGKQIVQMGEVAHGIAEQNRLRVRVFKYLHQHHGFNVIAFESGFYECFRANQMMTELDAESLLKSCLYSFWHTGDLLDLFQYIQDSCYSENPVILAGFDIQQTGSGDSQRPEFLKNTAAYVDEDFADMMYAAYNQLLSVDYDNQVEYVQNNYEALMDVFSTMYELIEANREILIGYMGESEYNLALKTAFGMKYYIALKNRDEVESAAGLTNARDYAMGELLVYLKDVQFKNKKMVVWAHNFHTTKHSDEIDSDQGTAMYPPLMGDILEHFYGEAFYAVGSLSYEGRINYGIVPEILITRDNSVEAILDSAEMKWMFIDMSLQEQNEGNSWMFEKIPQKYLHSREGTYYIHYVPSRQYDGYLFIKNVTRPFFL